ncbi:hypothetical protein BGZ58_009677, partial [Dissophora ornata]
MEETYQDRSLPEEVPTSSSGSNRTNDSDDVESHNPAETDYYAVLNVSHTASEEDIKEAYKRMSRVFHPDRHEDASLKEAAGTKVQVLNRAFEVLSNPQLRAAYDEYGEGGLNTKWEVGHKIKTPQEMRDEYAHMAREEQQMELENLVRSRNDIIINLDASRVFENYHAPVPFGLTKKTSRASNVLDSLQRTGITQLFMKNSFQFGSSLLNPGVSVIKSTYNIDSQTYVAGTAFTRNFQGPTPLVLTLGRRITKGATGYMTYRTGEWALGSWGPALEDRQDLSSMSLGVMSVDTKDSYQVEVQAGVMQSHLLADRTWILDDSTRIRVGGRVSSLAGVSASIGGDRKITQYTKLGLAVEIALSGGIAFNLNPKFALWTAVAPICAIAALDLGYIKPKKRRERAEKLRELRRVHAEFITRQKKEAEEATNLLRESTARKTKQEQETDGLVIVEAVYGNVNAGLVADNHILGFYDPCLGEKKQLRIRYEFQKRMHEVVVADMDHVALPVR